MSSQATGSAESLVNTTTASNQGSPSTTALADGGWVVIWTGNGPGDTTGIFQQRYDASGVAVGVETRINGHTSDAQFLPFVAALPDGGWIATWSGAGADDSMGVFQQRFDSTGAMVGSQARVNATISGDQLWSSAAGLEDGGWLVAWSGNGTGDDDGVMLRRYEADGDTVAAPDVRVNATTTGAQNGATVTALADGGWLVAWDSDADGGTRSIHQQRYTNAWAAVGAQTEVDQAAGDRRTPSLAQLADGGWIVTWDGWASLDQHVFQRRYDSAGSAIGGEMQVNTTTSGTATNSRVVALGDGGWLVVWEDQGPGVKGIYQQRYNASGGTVGGETLVNTTPGGSPANASVTVLEDGSWVVSWESSDQNGTSAGVSQRHFAPHKVGTAGNDTLTGTSWDERLEGRDGNDSLRGELGDDTIWGGEGRDNIFGGAGRDLILGHDGNDTMRGDAGNDTLLGGRDNDRLLGGADNDTLSGDGGNDKLDGGTGKDYVAGGADNDVLIGGIGNDSLLGGSGADKLHGGAGRDTLTGGADADRFQFKSIADSGTTSSTRDRVADFKKSDGDRLDLSAIDADTTLKGNQAFIFDAAEGSSSSTPATGHIAWYRDAFFSGGSDTYVLVNHDGDLDVDMVIQLKGRIGLADADFIL